MQCLHLDHTLKKTKIKYCWIPGHVGIPGNDCADKAAKSANASREAFVPLIDALQAVKLSQYRAWQRIWDGQSNNKVYKIQPSIKGFGNLTIRKHDVILTRLRIWGILQKTITVKKYCLAATLYLGTIQEDSYGKNCGLVAPLDLGNIAGDYYGKNYCLAATLYLGTIPEDSYGKNCGLVDTLDLGSI
ncbi:hypothetical protein AVEN_37088-1 [Araneus ventricosus]|uniref:RNase H type-1 domain-containing protein n=1 Tax=Araneus ventricosus TaxID=182803 RepID=A0A4Y2HQJ8_ARAVE|nr:hypothetical protein AVEN_37088-1 [Araneus ventricosus]